MLKLKDEKKAIGKAAQVEANEDAKFYDEPYSREAADSPQQRWRNREKKLRAPTKVRRVERRYFEISQRPQVCPLGWIL